MKAYVLSQGHMDIEWYLPMHSYRFWMVEAMERQLALADKGEAVPYTLDGQIFPLTEYLAARPERREAVKRLAADGLLKLGPFYTQFDEWLPSGESIVRNCLYGLKETGKYTDKPMREGYLPDNFGHPVQLPQILRGFGIGSLIFVRGMVPAGDDFPDEFSWKGADGSRLTAIFFREGYARIYGKDFTPGPHHPQISPMFMSTPYTEDTISYSELLDAADIDNPEATAKDMVESARRIAKNYPSGVLPIAVGADHCPPQAGLKKAVERANAMQSEIEFVISDPAEYIAAVNAAGNKLPEINEDLIGSRYNGVLLSAMSSRTYIKRLHFEAEQSLTYYAEPLHALAVQGGMRPETELLSEAWRYLMMNSAHDSIHGSSVDSVHEDMVSRYNAVKQIAAGLAHQSLEFICNNGRNYGNVYTPPTGVKHTLPRYTEFWASADDGLGSVTLKDERLPYQVAPLPTLPVNELGQETDVYYPWPNKRRFLVQLPEDSETFSSIKLDPRGANAQPSESVNNYTENGNLVLENSLLKLTFRGALLDIYDKRTKQLYAGQNLIKEEAECGDPWDSSNTWVPSPEYLSSGCEAKVSLTEAGPLRSTVTVSYTMLVPKDLQSRFTGERVPMPVKAEISLYAGVPRADVRLTVTNTARDHKLSLLSVTNIAADCIYTESIYGRFSRPLTPDRRAHGKKQAQPSTRIYPFREWAAAEDGRRGLAIAVKGLYEVEPSADSLLETANIRITLLRGYGNMNRINSRMRESLAAMNAPTPGAQCLGEQVLSYSFMPYVPDDGFSEPLETYLHPSMCHMSEGKTPHGRLPGFISWNAENLLLSGIKTPEDGTGIVLRLWENAGHTTTFTLNMGSFANAELLTLNEEHISDKAAAWHTITLTVEPYRIITLRLY